MQLHTPTWNQVEVVGLVLCFKTIEMCVDLHLNSTHKKTQSIRNYLPYINKYFAIISHIDCYDYTIQFKQGFDQRI